MKKTRLVYILAASHSGSTLLAILLGGHPAVCTAGELKATSMGDVDRYLCSCQARIRECPFWAGMKQEMADRGFAFDITDAGTDLFSGAGPYLRRLLRPLHRGPALELVRDTALSLSPVWRSRLSRFQARNSALIESLRARTGKDIVVDSSKVGIRVKYLLRNPTLDVRVVRLIRDGRGVVLAYVDPASYADAANPRLRGGGTGRSREDEKLAVAEASLEWRRSNEEAEAILAGLDPSRWRNVRYEDLCADPDRTLRFLFDFIGADAGVGVERLDFEGLHVVGNGMRLDFSRRIRLDERWRQALGPADLRVFDSVAGSLNRKLGYL
ncbi:MAG: sulfotransferase [Candidatus Deferrimicrobiaceae bacterium]